MAEAGQGILRRKVMAARAEAAAGGPGADRCWRLALARASRDRLKTTLEFRSLALDRRSLGELVEMAPKRALIAVLDGPGEGLGVIMLSPQIMAGVIEAQTIGKIKSGEVVLRKSTRTDAAMVAGLIDAALRGLEQALAEEADLVWAGGFRYASFLDDPRPLGLLMEDTTYRVLRAEVDLGGGARTGEVLLALPSDGRGMAPNSRNGLSESADHGHVFMQALAERVSGAQSGLEGVLARLTLPLNEVLRLEPGTVLALPQAGLDRISLEGTDGRRVAEGRLGQNRGMRAIRLNEGLSGDATAPTSMTGMEMVSGPDLGGATGFVNADQDGPGFDGPGFDGVEFRGMEGAEMMFPATGTG